MIWERVIHTQKIEPNLNEARIFSDVTTFRILHSFDKRFNYLVYLSSIKEKKLPTIYMFLMVI